MLPSMEQESFAQEYTIEKKQEEYAQDNVFLLRDKEGSLIARHNIYPLSTENVLNFFVNSTNSIYKYRHYPVFGGYLESYQRGKGIGMRMWEYCEEDFFNNQDTSYLRFVFDADVENKWTTRHVSELVEELNRRGVPVRNLAQKTWAKKYMGILLFEK